MDAEDLIEQFFDRLEPALLDRADPARLRPLLERLLARARQAWPGIELPAAHFVAALAERLAPEGDPLERDPLELLEGLRCTDLYLACACARGDGRAIARFEAEYGPMIGEALADLRLSPDVTEELWQDLRANLFTALSGDRPKIASYSGQGDLRRWVRATAVHAAIDHGRKRQPEHPVDDRVFAELVDPTDDPELQHLKQLYRAEFGAAVARAMQRLSPRERNLLRYGAVERLTVDQIAPLYGVHRATAARWLARARDALLEHTRQALLERLQLGDNDFASVMRLLHSRLDVSIRGLLVDSEVEPDAAGEGPDEGVSDDGVPGDGVPDDGVPDDEVR